MSFTTSDQDDWRAWLPANRSVFGSLEYAKICETFRGCTSLLYVLKSDAASICHPMLLRPVSDLPFHPNVEGVWDSTTPDYTGPLVQGSDRDLMNRFPELHGAFAREQGIIAEFAHVHPWSAGRDLLDEGCTYNRDIIWVDVTQSSETLFRDHFEHSCRKNINKAQREGVMILAESDDCALEEFSRIYSATMRRNQALGRYSFSLDFFKRIRDDLPENAKFVFAQHSGRMVAATLYLYDDNDVFSFLGGADAEFNSLRPTNLVVWDTIQWAHQTGKKRLILGAGFRPNDGIYQFKATFSPHRQPFYVYKRIHRADDFALLDKHCREYNCIGDKSVDYFPSYRYVAE
jgi:serine/alanine adding enzyme